MENNQTKKTTDKIILPQNIQREIEDRLFQRIGAVNMVSTGISAVEHAKESYSIKAHEEKLREYTTQNTYAVYADKGTSDKDIDGRPAQQRI